MTITIISGTNRPESNTRRVAAHVQSLYTEFKTANQVLDLANLPAEVFLPSAYAAKPPAFKPFSDAVLSSSGLVVITPEYNGGMPGVLKLFIDMLKFPESFASRPVCFVGLAAGTWGGIRPVEHLQQIFGYRNAYIFPERVFLPKVQDLIDGAGQLADAEIQSRLRSQAKGFLEFCGKFVKAGRGAEPLSGTIPHTE